MAMESEDHISLMKKEYSDEEISLLYELARFQLENGQLKSAESVLEGILAVAPDYSRAWLARSYLHILSKDYDAAIFCARQALRIQPDFVAANLYLATCFLRIEDYHSAGTQLGEVAEFVEGGKITDRNILRMYRMQLARFQGRVGG